MILTVDSNVLLSVFSKDALYERASHLLERYSTGEFVINDSIYLELGVHFSARELLDESLAALEVSLLRSPHVDIDAILSGWKRYLKRRSYTCPSCKKAVNPVCAQCGQPLAFRQRILTDFLIAGFALSNSDGLITLDPTYYRNYFPGLTIFEL